MTGKIIKGIAGFYYVHCADHQIYECKAKGIFRNKKIKPLVGANVEITVLNTDPPEGNIDRILEHWHAEGVDTLDKAKADSGRSGKTAGKAKSAGKDTSLDMDAYMEQVMSRAPVYKK